MEQGPKITTAEKPKAEKKKFTATIVDTSELMKEQAIDIGNEKMTMEAESEELAKLKLWGKMGKKEFWNRLGKKTWKHGLKRDYNFNNEVYKASQEIIKSGNVFIGEGKDKIAHEKVMADIIDQFSLGYDETIHEDVGEKKILLKDQKPEEKASKEEVKQLIKDYATGKITKESFKAQEERLFHDLKEKVDEKEIKENTMYASNLLEVAEQVKLAMANQEFLENEDFEVDVIYGRSMAGVRSQENFNRTERVMDKMLRSKLGQFTNETTIAMALSCAGALLTRSVASIPGKVVPILGTALISSGFAKKREEMQQIRQRTAHNRDMAKGETFDSKKMPVRAEYEKFRYHNEAAGDLIKNIDTNLNILETKGASVTEEELNSVFADLASLEALIRLSDDRRIDMITYSDSTKVVEERKTLDIKRRQMKNSIEKAFESAGIQVPYGRTFESHLRSLTSVQEYRLVNEEKTGIDAKDSGFDEMKRREGRRAAVTAFKTGIVIGAFASEVIAGADGLWGGQRIGIVEDVIHGNNPLPPSVDVAHLSAATFVKHLIQGDLPKVEVGNMHEVLIGSTHMKLPEGVGMIKNADGTYNMLSGSKILGEHLTTNVDGTLTESAKNILAHNGISLENHVVDGTTTRVVNIEDHIKGNPKGMVNVDHRVWDDNDTHPFDGNELRTHYGGLNGTGFDEHHNIVMDVSHMKPGESFHDGISDNAQQLMKEGKLVMLFSASDGTQNKVFSFPVGPEGQIVIPEDSECAKLLWSNANGHAHFDGRYGEVAHDMGGEHYRVLSTMVGKGLNDVTETVTTHTNESVLTMVGMYDMDGMPVIPIVPGKPNETLTHEKEGKNKDIVTATGVPVEKTKTSQENSKTYTTIGSDERDLFKDGIIDAAAVSAAGVETVERKKTLTRMTIEEFDGMKDDIKMLNRKIQISEGIITLVESDFKSEYGKKRYLDLKHIAPGKPVTFNKYELQTIGDEMERMLSSALIVKKEDLIEKTEAEIAKAEKENVRTDLEMLNKSIQHSEGIVTLQESSFQSKMGKAMYLDLRHIASGKPVTFNKDELEIIATEMEKSLVGPKKTESKKVAPEAELASPTLEAEKDTTPIAVPIEEKDAPEEVSEDNEKVIPKTSKGEYKVKKGGIEGVYNFDFKDLFKTGTLSEDKENSYKTLGSKSLFGLFNNKIEVESVNKNTGEKKTIEIKKDKLSRMYYSGSLKVTKVE